jgi:hypothetical protein
VVLWARGLTGVRPPSKGQVWFLSRWKLLVRCSYGIGKFGGVEVLLNLSNGPKRKFLGDSYSIEVVVSGAVPFHISAPPYDRKGVHSQ